MHRSGGRTFLKKNLEKSCRSPDAGLRMDQVEQEWDPGRPIRLPV